jgi:pyruvate dehydrogenase E2 component (dihydrolipoamide acetyltransferase)
VASPAQRSATAPTAAKPEIAPAPKVFVPAGEVFTEEIKNSQMRKIIAKRLAESLFTAPHYNLTIEVAMDEAMKSRVAINSI